MLKVLSKTFFNYFIFWKFKYGESLRNKLLSKEGIEDYDIDIYPTRELSSEIPIVLKDALDKFC